MRRKEGKIEHYLDKRAIELGGSTRKLKWLGRSGAPDRLVLLPGRHIFVECKASDGKLSDHQAHELTELAAAGAETAVVWSKADVDKLL